MVLLNFLIVIIEKENKLQKMVENSPDNDEVLTPEQAQSLSKAISGKLKKKTKPVPCWENDGRGWKGDPEHLMEKCI